MNTTKHTLSKFFAVFAVLVFAAATAAVPAEKAETRPVEPKSAEAEEKIVGDIYTLQTCAVCDTELSLVARPKSTVHDGREMRFCCPNCMAEFKENPEEALKDVNKAMFLQQVAYYPVTEDIVTGEPLGAKGAPVQHFHGNRLVMLNSEESVEKFKAEPKKYLDKLDAAAIEMQNPMYPMEVCVVSGQKLGSMGDPVEKVYGNRLVKFCCAGCIGKFEQNPAKFFKKLDEAKAEPAAMKHKMDEGMKEKMSREGHKMDKMQDADDKKESSGGHEGHNH